MGFIGDEIKNSINFPFYETVSQLFDCYLFTNHAYVLP